MSVALLLQRRTLNSVRRTLLIAAQPAVAVPNLKSGGRLAKATNSPLPIIAAVPHTISFSGVAALAMIVTVAILSSLALQVRYARSVRKPVIKPVFMKNISAASHSIGSEMFLQAVAGSLATVVMFTVITSGELQRQVKHSSSMTCSRSAIEFWTKEFAK